MRTAGLLLMLLLAVLGQAANAAAGQGERDPGRLVLNAVGDCAHPVQHYPEELRQLRYRVHDAVLPILRQGDLNFVNLETPITDRPPVLKKMFAFNAPFESLLEIERAGFNLISLANNHMGDAGEAGIRDTEAHLARLARTRPLFWAGAGSRQGAVFFQLPGHSKTIAFLAWGNEANVAEFKEEKPEPALAAVREAAARADVVIVSVHGGAEYRHVPSPELARAYRRMIEAGASVVLGHHPHVAQGVEVHGNGLILYSLGNYSLSSKTIRHHATGAKLYGLLPTITFHDNRLAEVRIRPLYVNNLEPLVVGDQTLQPTPFAPQIATGVFADHILDQVVRWSGEIAGNATRFSRSGDLLQVRLPAGDFATATPSPAGVSR